MSALHEEEVPIAVLAWQQAEINRDRKKNKQASKLSDFFLYADSSVIDTVDAIYGAAAVKLAEMKEFPSWALFAWKDLTKNADQAAAPKELFYRGSACILLAPEISEGMVRGFLLAKKSQSGKEVLLFNSRFKPIRVRLPKLEGEVAAIENCYLEILRYS